MNENELIPEFEDDEDDMVYSAALGEFQILRPLPPMSEKGREAQDEELRRFGFNPEDVPRPPIDEINDEGFVLPDTPAGDGANER